MTKILAIFWGGGTFIRRGGEGKIFQHFLFVELQRFYQRPFPD